MSENPPICERCGKGVEKNREQYDLFERMHWLCFHLEYEHDGDPDTSCDDPSCPWWHLEVFQGKLNDLGEDPVRILEEAIQSRYGGDDG